MSEGFARPLDACWRTPQKILGSGITPTIARYLSSALGVCAGGGRCIAYGFVCASGQFIGIAFGAEAGVLHIQSAMFPPLPWYGSGSRTRPHSVQYSNGTYPYPYPCCFGSAFALTGSSTDATAHRPGAHSCSQSFGFIAYDSSKTCLQPARPRRCPCRIKDNTALGEVTTAGR